MVSINISGFNEGSASLLTEELLVIHRHVVCAQASMKGQHLY